MSPCVIILKMDKNKIFRLLKLFEQVNEMRKKNQQHSL